MQSIDLNQFQDLNEQEITRRMLADDPVRRIVLVSMPAGQGLPEHGTPGPASVYVISGRVLFYEEGEQVEIGAGVLLALTPGTTHKLEAKEDSRLLVTMMKAPDAAAWNSLVPAGRDLDLRGTPHERRHSIVFWAFNALNVGEAFFLVNDHNPKPLRTQMESLYPGELAWEYVRQEPGEFRIKISRTASKKMPPGPVLATPGDLNAPQTA